MIKPKLELDKLTDADLLTLAVGIKNAMTTNAAEFPASAASVTALGTSVTAFGASRQAAEDGKTAQQALVDAKDADRATVEEKLRTLAGQVNEAAKGDVNIIHDAGMAASSERAPISMTQVLNLVATAGDHGGEVELMWEPVYGAKTYVVQKCADPMTEGNWQQVDLCTKSKFTVPGLTPGTKYWFRVAAKGADPGLGAWSDPAQKMSP